MSVLFSSVTSLCMSLKCYTNLLLLGKIAAAVGNSNYSYSYTFLRSVVCMSAVRLSPSVTFVLAHFA